MQMTPKWTRVKCERLLRARCELGHLTTPAKAAPSLPGSAEELTSASSAASTGV